MLSAVPKAETDKTYQNLDYIAWHKNRTYLIVLLYIVLKKNNDKYTVARNLN